MLYLFLFLKEKEKKLKIKKSKRKGFFIPQYKDNTNSPIIQIKILFVYSKLNHYLCTAVGMFTIF